MDRPHDVGRGLLPSEAEGHGDRLEPRHVREAISRIRPLVGTSKKELNRGRWEERETKAYLAGDPVDACVEKLAGYVRAHWCVEVYHGKRDNGYHEDKLTLRMDLNIMSAMMVARSLGIWVCARSPGKSTEASAEKGENRTPI